MEQLEKELNSENKIKNNKNPVSLNKPVNIPSFEYAEKFSGTRSRTSGWPRRRTGPNRYVKKT